MSVVIVYFCQENLLKGLHILLLTCQRSKLSFVLNFFTAWNFFKNYNREK